MVSIRNNLLHRNGGGYGLAIACSGYVDITNNTIHENTTGTGSSVSCGPDVTIKNSILWNNHAPEISGMPTVTYSNIMNGYAGEGNINETPQFVTGPHGDYYLSQVAAGQAAQSPCADAGDPAGPIIHGTTRTDSVQDTGAADMGYHYPIYLFNPRVTPWIGTESTLFTYHVDVVMPAGQIPFRVYLEIDGAYAGEMTLISGTAGSGTYAYSTYLQGTGYHQALFHTNLSALPIHLPLIPQLKSAFGTEPQIRGIE